jgi:hypothetical protein
MAEPKELFLTYDEVLDELGRNEVIRCVTNPREISRSLAAISSAKKFSSSLYFQREESAYRSLRRLIERGDFEEKEE